jgi:hypothetical protein
LEQRNNRVAVKRRRQVVVVKGVPPDKVHIAIVHERAPFLREDLSLDHPERISVAIVRDELVVVVLAPDPIPVERRIAQQHANPALARQRARRTAAYGFMADR